MFHNIYKMFDNGLLYLYRPQLSTSDMKFGFKARHSTSLCTLIFKEVINHYINNNHYVLVLVIWPYTKAGNAATSVWAFPWMWPKSTISFILLVLFKMPNQDMDPIFYLRTDARQARRF